MGTGALARDEFTVSTRFWHRLADGRIQCDLCPRACKLREGQRGVCFVRARLDDEVVLTSYGRSSGFCVDPIEKKPLNHFLPGTSVLSFGTAGTSCPGCGTMLIERDWYRLGRYQLTGDGHCPACGTAIAGVFDGDPGTWGPRRLPVRLAGR